MNLVTYCYTNQWSDHIWNMQIPCDVNTNKVILQSLKKIEKELPY